MLTQNTRGTLPREACVIKDREVGRTLIQIPVAHTQEDMGSLGRRLPIGATHSRLAQARWSEIWEQVQALGVDWPEVRVYQDGLPDAEPAIIEKVMAEVHSANYDLLRWLVAQGARVTGTESSELMKEEYAHLRAVLTAKDAAAKAKARRAYAERAAALLSERDAYIARRITETLPPGAVGILFIGRAHDVAKHLPADVTVRELACSSVPTTTKNARPTGTRDRHP